MVLNFGNELFNQTFKDSPEDTQVLFREGSRQISDNITPTLTSSTIAAASNITNGVFQEIDTITVSNLKTTQAILIFASIQWNCSSSQTGLNFKFLKDGVQIGITLLDEESTTSMKSNFSYHFIDTPTLSSHVYTIEVSGAGTSSNDIDTGTFTALVIN